MLFRSAHYTSFSPGTSPPALWKGHRTVRAFLSFQGDYEGDNVEFNDRKVGVQTREPAPWGQGPWGQQGAGVQGPRASAPQLAEKVGEVALLDYFPHAVCVLSHFDHISLIATLWTVARQAPLSMGFSRQEYWSGLPSSRGFSQPRDRTCVSYVSCIGRCVLYQEVSAVRAKCPTRRCRSRRQWH